MGLDITAYSHLKHIGLHKFDTETNEGEAGPWCYHEDHVQAYAYDCFPDSFRGIPVIDKRQAGGTSFFWGGCFEITDVTETHSFRAGSYSGYNAWRQDLASQFNPAPFVGQWPREREMREPDPKGPFYELIWFADNEGSIGPEAAADLLADFREHAEQYTPPSDDIHGWYRRKYADWTRAFKLAADGGLVWFH